MNKHGRKEKKRDQNIEKSVKNEQTREKMSKKGEKTYGNYIVEGGEKTTECENDAK